MTLLYYHKEKTDGKKEDTMGFFFGNGGGFDFEDFILFEMMLEDEEEEERNRLDELDELDEFDEFEDF